MLIACVAFCLPAAAQDVHTDYDHQRDFSQYHTYSWTKIHTDNPLWQSRVQDAINNQLDKKGWQLMPSGGQVSLSAVGAVRNQQEYRTFYSGMGGWGWGGGFGTQATTTVDNERIGTLVVDMYDTASKQLVWRGVAEDTLSDKAEKNQGRLQKSVDKMLKDFPPK
jgi:hypothetical protein